MYTSKKIFIGLLIVSSILFSGCTQEETDLILPLITYCGMEEPLQSDGVSKITYMEESSCEILGGEMFINMDEAKSAYGTRINLMENPTEVSKVSQTFSAGQQQDISVGDTTLHIGDISFEGIEITGSDNEVFIPLGETQLVDGNEVRVTFACGDTYTTVLEVSEPVCCPDEEESEEDDDSGDNEELTGARKQTEQDLAASGRTGYKGVILPSAVARDYPSTDFAMMDFVAIPTDICCGCRQEYSGFANWGAYVSGDVLRVVVNTVNQMNGHRSGFESSDDDAFSVIERSEAGLRSILNELNYVHTNREYFDPSTILERGHLINPDYVIDGSIKFECCEGAETVRVVLTAQIVDAESEKVREEITYTPVQCYDLTSDAGPLRQAISVFARQVGDSLETRFGG